MAFAHLLLVGVDGVQSSQHGHQGQVAEGTVELIGIHRGIGLRIRGRLGLESFAKIADTGGLYCQ